MDNSENIKILKNRLINNDFSSLISITPNDSLENLEVEIYERNKNCIKCKQKKDLDDFGILKKSKDGYRNVCKECECKYAKERYEKTKKYRRARIKFWKLQNPEMVKINNRRAQQYRRERLYKRSIQEAEENKKIYYDPLGRY
jgi:hypothetical protein